MDLSSVVKFFGAPGSIRFLTFSLAIGALLLLPRRLRPLGQVLLAGTVVLYALLSLPVVAESIRTALGTPASPVLERSVDALIVFDGDNRVGRAVQACRAAVALSIPIWVLGEEWLLEQLEDCGIVRTRLHHEARVGTTLDQIDWVARFVQDRGASRVAVVASQVQMPRVRGLAAGRRLNLVFVPSALDRELPHQGWRRFAPSASALRTSQDAIYEHVALRYYRWRGWIADP